MVLKEITFQQAWSRSRDIDAFQRYTLCNSRYLGAFLPPPASSYPQYPAYREFLALDTTRRHQHVLRRVDAILEGDTGEGVDYKVEECVGMRFILLVMRDDRVRKTRMKSRAPRQRWARRNLGGWDGGDSSVHFNQLELLKSQTTIYKVRTRI